MNISETNRTHSASSAALADAETTLRLVTQLPVPKGLEERIKTALSTAPQTGRVLVWPASPTALLHSTLARSAAAAAIVLAVAGGGWSVYLHVRPAEPVRAIAMPQHVAAPGQFSSAGAMRTPQSETAPVVAPQKAGPADKPDVPKKTAKKAMPSTVTQTARP
jgi:hypothetical protein